jgi:hypothetical protein
VRIPAVVYGAHVVTTVLPIMAIMVLGSDKDFPGGKAPSSMNRLVLAYGAYLPFLLIPLLLVLRMALYPIGSSSLKQKHQ